MSRNKIFKTPEGVDPKKNLMLRYSIHQILFWAMYCSGVTYGTTYLLGKGLDASVVGLIMFSVCAFSFFVQIPLANYADKHADRNTIKALMTGLTCVSIAAFALISIFDLPMVILAPLFVLAGACMDMMIGLMNSLCVFYSDNGYHVSFEFPRALAAFMFGIASLLVGYVIRDYGNDWMPIITIIFAGLFLQMTVTYPKVKDIKVKNRSVDGKKTSSSLPEFCRKYKFYVISLLAVMLYAIVHSAMENYLIEIFKGLGGDSSNQGWALFIATCAETVYTIIAMSLMKKLGLRRIWVIAGISFLGQAVIFLAAKSVAAVYVGQLLQFSAYSVIPPAQVYYSRLCISEKDMVKGQTTSTASYTMGCALGNLIGGSVVSAYGVPAMLVVSGVLSVIGAGIAFVFVPKALNTGRR